VSAEPRTFGAAEKSHRLRVHVRFGSMLLKKSSWILANHDSVV
jgi:hypothetical protein